MRVFPAFPQETQGVPIFLVFRSGPAPSECQRSGNLTLPWTTGKKTAHRSSCYPKKMFFLWPKNCKPTHKRCWFNRNPWRICMMNTRNNQNPLTQTPSAIKRCRPAHARGVETRRAPFFRFADSAQDPSFKGSMSEFKLGHSKKFLHWQCNNSPNLRAPTCLQRWPHILTHTPGWLKKYDVVPVSPQGISQQKNSGSPPPNVPMKAAAPTTLEGDTRDLWLETVWSRHVWGTRKGLVSQLQQCRFWPWRNVWLYQSDQPSWHPLGCTMTTSRSSSPIPVARIYVYLYLLYMYT